MTRSTILVGSYQAHELERGFATEGWGRGGELICGDMVQMIAAASSAASRCTIELALRAVV